MSESRTVGTPGEYTNDLYRVYFELGEHAHLARGVLESFLGSRSQYIPGMSFSAQAIRHHAHGYEVDIPLQLIPEVVRELASANVAIYQVLRISKL